jgi:hypothetical protein
MPDKQQEYAELEDKETLKLHQQIYFTHGFEVTDFNQPILMSGGLHLLPEFCKFVDLEKREVNASKCLLSELSSKEPNDILCFINELLG